MVLSFEVPVSWISNIHSSCEFRLCRDTMLLIHIGTFMVSYFAIPSLKGGHLLWIIEGYMCIRKNAVPGGVPKLKLVTKAEKSGEIKDFFLILNISSLSAYLLIDYWLVTSWFPWTKKYKKGNFITCNCSRTSASSKYTIHRHGAVKKRGILRLYSNNP